ncbi:MAG: VanZ family protein [Cyclobacteriaceae bacterium]
MDLNRRLIPAIAWTLGIIYALYSPESNVPKMPRFRGFDKIIHFCLFFGLAFLWCRVINAYTNENDGKKSKFFTNYLVLWIFLAIFTEFLQQLVPGRSFDYLDIMANIAGGTIGTIVFVYLNKKGSILV